MTFSQFCESHSAWDLFASLSGYLYFVILTINHSPIRSCAFLDFSGPRSLITVTQNNKPSPFPDTDSRKCPGLNHDPNPSQNVTLLAVFIVLLQYIAEGIKTYFCLNHHRNPCQNPNGVTTILPRLAIKILKATQSLSQQTCYKLIFPKTKKDLVVLSRQ